MHTRKIGYMSLCLEGIVSILRGSVLDLWLAEKMSNQIVKQIYVFDVCMCICLGYGNCEEWVRKI